MNGVGIAMAAEFLQLQAARRITTVFHGGVTGNASRTLVGVRAAFRTFQSYNDADAFAFGHGYRTNFSLD